MIKKDKDKLKEELTELETRVAKIKEELSKPELKPFDYLGPYWVDAIGHVKDMVDYPGATRNALTEKGAEILAKQHRWQVLMQSLRDSLGCGDYSFTSGGSFTDGGSNYYVFYHHFHHKWNTCSGARCEHVEQFYFPTKEMAEQVVDYLNQNYKDGFK